VPELVDVGLILILKERILSFEGGSSGSHYEDSSLWKRFWTCRKTDYYMKWSNSAFEADKMSVSEFGSVDKIDPNVYRRNNELKF
jgi:hypothetical protein